MLGRFLVAVISGLAVSTEVFAAEDWQLPEWKTEVKEDLFSGKSVAFMQGGLLKPFQIQISCENEQRYTSFAVIFGGNAYSELEGTTGTVVVKVDDHTPHRLDVSVYQHNAFFNGYRTYLNDPLLIATLNDIRLAKKSILVGLQIPKFNYQRTENYEVTGAAASATEFIKACGI
jgi:hypothetical protein